MMSLGLLIAWLPFRQPLPGVQDHWLWLLPILVLGISMMYKAIRTTELSRWPREVLVMTGQVLLAFAGLAVGLFLLVQVVVPLLPAS